MIEEQIGREKHMEMAQNWRAEELREQAAERRPSCFEVVPAPDSVHSNSEARQRSTFHISLKASAAGKCDGIGQALIINYMT